MDLLLTLFLLLSFAAWLWLLRVLKPIQAPESVNLPPGPNPFPLSRQHLELGEKPHQSLAKLSKIYGPLMRLKLGSMTTVVVSSPEIAKIVLQKYDQLFSSRTHVDAIRPGPEEGEVGNLRDYVKDCCVNGEAVNIGRAAFTTSLNLMSATLFSKEFATLGSADSSQEFRDIVCGIMSLVCKPNLADYFPLLQLVDPHGIFRENTVYFKKCFAIFDEIIRQRQQTSDSSTPKNDMLEALLQINQKNESEFSFYDIKHLLLDLFVAGTDTTSSTVEWAMTELLRSPDKMSKARNELRDVWTEGRNPRIRHLATPLP
ncbi:UNVERIFIED_CONTAM: cytochrome [Sesamum radiatum]|uniref:Cytochrome n=1 Tax=Sesamum radiatum TaxID=300843 RepID=A0AAW2VIG2_SESRA